MQLSKTKTANPSKLDPLWGLKIEPPERTQQQERTVELIGVEPTTSALQGRRSPN